MLRDRAYADLVRRAFSLGGQIAYRLRAPPALRGYAGAFHRIPRKRPRVPVAASSTGKRWSLPSAGRDVRGSRRRFRGSVEVPSWPVLTRRCPTRRAEGRLLGRYAPLPPPLRVNVMALSS